MATEKLNHTISVDNVDKTEALNKSQLTYSVDTLLSNPQNKRYHERFEGLSLLELFEAMTENLQPYAKVKISNGTKTTELTVEDWKSWISMNLSIFDPNDKSPSQNVWINVSSRAVDKEDIEIVSL